MSSKCAQSPGSTSSWRIWRTQKRALRCRHDSGSRKKSSPEYTQSSLVGRFPEVTPLQCPCVIPFLTAHDWCPATRMYRNGSCCASGSPLLTLMPHHCAFHPYQFGAGEECHTPCAVLRCPLHRLIALLHQSPDSDADSDLGTEFDTGPAVCHVCMP